jgi:hypothetical protein
LTLAIGETFKFTLTFNPAPQGYGGGEIHYRFRNVTLTQKMTANPRFMFPPPTPLIDQVIPLQDGVSKYALEIPISDSTPPGVWQLDEVTIGRAVQKLVVLSEPVRFEVLAERPIAVKVRVPETVRAGEKIRVAVYVDDFPERLVKDCQALLNASLASTYSEYPATPVRLGASIPLQLGEHTYELSTSLLADSPTGEWTGSVGLSPGRHRMCSFPPLEGNQFRFTVAAGTGLVTPASVSVTVSPSQIQLLRGQAIQLQSRIQDVKAALIILQAGETSSERKLLRENLASALGALRRTQTQFLEMSKGHDEAGEVFFNDLALNYQQAQHQVEIGSDQAERPSVHLQTASFGSGKSPKAFSLLAQVALGTFERNVLAYDSAIESESLYFSLTVKSDPEGAKISYKRRGDSGYQSPRDPTDTTVGNLVKAVWIIHLHLAGYQDWESEYDPFTEPDRVITAIMKH